MVDEGMCSSTSARLRRHFVFPQGALKTSSCFFLSSLLSFWVLHRQMALFPIWMLCQRDFNVSLMRFQCDVGEI